MTNEPKIRHISFTFCVIAGAILLLFGHLYEMRRSWKTGSCERKNTVIFYRYSRDYETACNGISRAERFFQIFGYSIDIPIYVFFKYSLPVDKEIYDPGQVWGYVNLRSLYILIPSSLSPVLKKTGAVFFRLEADNESIHEEILTSTVAHEVAHLLALHNFEIHTNLALETHQREKMGESVQEYIASIVQFHSMERYYRKQITDQFDANLIFDDEQEINRLMFYYSPQKFYIMSYRHFQSQDWNNQRQLLERIFTNQLNPDLIFDISL